MIIGHPRTRKQRRKLKLYREQGGLCCYCEKPVVLVMMSFEDGKQPNFPDTLATLEHLDDRFSPERGAFTGLYIPRTALACLKCNLARGRYREAIQPKHVLQDHAQRHRAK